MNDTVIAPAQIINEVENASIKKAAFSFKRLAVLGLLGGMFVALSAQASLAATYAITNPNAAKIIVGFMFCAGVIFAIIAGAEIFVTDNLMVVAALNKKITVRRLLITWVVVFLANLIGSVFIASIINASGQLSVTQNLLGAVTIKTAIFKSTLPSFNAFLLGILCNMFICLGAWMAYATSSLTGKVTAILFPILLFNICNLENSVANMYYIPSGIIASFNPQYVEAAIKIGVSPESISALGLLSLMKLIPVALGNIVGGGIFVGGAYWLVYKSKILD